MKISTTLTALLAALLLAGTALMDVQAQETLVQEMPDEPADPELRSLVNRITEVILYDPHIEEGSKYKSVLIGLEKIDDKTYRIARVDEVPGLERFAPAWPPQDPNEDPVLWQETYVWIISFGGFLEKETHEMYLYEDEADEEEEWKVLGVFDEELRYSPPYTANQAFSAGLLHISPKNHYFYGTVIYSKIRGNYAASPMGLPDKELFEDMVTQRETGQYLNPIEDIVRNDGQETEIVVNGNTIIRDNPHYPGAVIVEYMGAPRMDEQVDRHQDYYLGYRSAPRGAPIGSSLEGYEGPGMPGVRVRYRPPSTSMGGSSYSSRRTGRVYYGPAHKRPQPTYYMRKLERTR